MNETEIHLVQESFAGVEPISDTAARIFYDRLFELDPSLRSLFPTELDEQRGKLMASLAFVVRNLREPEEFLPAVQRLGERHVGYRVQAEHYDTVGAALLFALGQGLGDKFTTETEAAWTTAYNLLATAMIDAANTVAA